ncbi:MAG: tyrosine-type recombinase/integrase [Proteobacteria bacterium]|nr:tyrosine-type recombinase/integrase [Pseudomonadota bacterium]
MFTDDRKFAHFAGMRIGDIVAIEWGRRDGEYLSKTGQLAQIKAPRPLRDELTSASRSSTHIVANEKARPYTRDGLQTILWRLVKRLVDEKRIEPGRCFHGLRHSPGAALYDLGLDREARKAALGHTSDAALDAHLENAKNAK